MNKTTSKWISIPVHLPELKGYTMKNPYLVYTEEHFDLLNVDMDSWFRLVGVVNGDGCFVQDKVAYEIIYVPVSIKTTKIQHIKDSEWKNSMFYSNRPSFQVNYPMFNEEIHNIQTIENIGLSNENTVLKVIELKHNKTIDWTKPVK